MRPNHLDLPVPFQASLNTVDGTAALRVAGEIDISTAAQFDAALSAAIAEQTRSVVVDLSRVSFLEPVGISILVRGRHTLAESSRRLSVICIAGSPVLSALEFVDLESHLELHAVDAVDDVDGEVSA